MMPGTLDFGMGGKSSWAAQYGAATTGVEAMLLEDGDRSRLIGELEKLAAGRVFISL